jgi:geranylgeranyl diphosphate synthase type I
MQQYFDRRKERIAAWLEGFFREKSPELGRVSPLGAELGGRLLRFCARGKMLRGGLVSIGAALAGRGKRRDALGQPPGVVPAGAAMELLQSGLLVHDDIMDRDATRRGQPTLHLQYAGEAAQGRAREPAHLGVSLGICAGDAAFFLAFEILARLPAPAGVAGALVGLCARELSRVAAAQMQDVSWGGTPAEVGEQDILGLYTYKTGRYTFSLPLLAGGLLGGCAPERAGLLERLGECLGVLFQIRDDELGLFGEEQELGKPVGSDVREGKKTLFYALLTRGADESSRARLQGIFGNPGATGEDLDFVRRQIEKLGVRQEVDSLGERYAQEAERLMDRLPAEGSEEMRVARELLRYTRVRTR